MNQELTDKFLKILLIWVFVCATVALPAACCKAMSAFHKQVIMHEWK